jgi:hypothetical protein
MIRSIVETEIDLAAALLSRFFIEEGFQARQKRCATYAALVGRPSSVVIQK